MNKKLKIGLVLSIITVAAVLAAVLAIVVIQPPVFGPQPPRRSDIVPDDFEYFYVALTIISTINIALLVILLLTYVSIFNKTRSQFTIGLILFAGVFLIKDITASPLVTGLFNFRMYGIGPFAFLPSVFELAALSVLLYLSIKY
jgi:hypothetical protein